MKHYYFLVWIVFYLLCSMSFAQYIGEVDTVGTTWYNQQHNGSCGRMIRVDVHGNLHVVWMNGLISGHRHIYYNMQDSTGWRFGITGTHVENSIRGGYVCLAVDNEGYPYPAFHLTNIETNPHAYSVCARDEFYGAGIFNYWMCPFSFPIQMELLYPKIAIDIDNCVQLILTEDTDYPDQMRRLFYLYGIYDPTMTEMLYSDMIEINRVKVFSADIAASRHSERVAIVYPHVRATIHGDTVSYNNDLYLVVSEDGANWNFEDPYNLTNFIPPDTTNPNPALVAGDTLRPFNDVSILFDMLDNVHVAFTTTYYNEINGTISTNNSMIWHWSDITGCYGLIADGWWGEGFPTTPDLRNVQRPCLAIDEERLELYCTWMKLDTNDIAANGIPQGEVMVSWSDNDGIHWTEPTNVTNTHAPGAQSGFLRHEADITCNETVVEDTLHIFYILYTDVGGGSMSENSVICQYVPISEIAHSPLIHPYPMHIDSTGYPSLSVRDNENANIPTSFHLAQNYPNPFNPTTMIQFDLHRTDHVTLKIYNILGQEITTLVDAYLSPGTYKVPFTADNLSSGIYFYTLEASTLIQTKKMVLLK